jgi:hypothetical protein
MFVAFSAVNASANLMPVLSAPNSVWNSPISATAVIDPNSETMVAVITASAALGTSANTTSYSDPIYVVPQSQPNVPVTLDASNNNLQKALDLGVPIPPKAQPASGTDSLLVIDQPSTNSLWDFWRASTPAENAPGAPLLPWGEPSHGDNQWHVMWGGVMNNVSHSPGYFDENSLPGLSTTWWGNSASSLLTAAGIPLIPEMEAGHIDHAVGFELPRWLNCAQVDNVWPAQRNDGSSTASNCIPEGTRLRLDPSVDLSTLSLSPLALMVARAAQKYGMILHDGDAFRPAIQLDDPTQYASNPYTGLTGLFGGLLASQVLANFPWSYMQVIKQGRHLDETRLATTTTVRSNSNSIVLGELVTFSIDVTQSDGSAARGAVYLKQGSTTLAMAILHGGTATLTARIYSLGTHTLTVMYGGDENSIKSTSGPTPVSVT